MTSLNKLLIASNNQKKLKEMETILSSLGFECINLKEAGIVSDPEETGTTFEENAFIKASFGMKESGLPCIADDSGLAVDALNGAPGVYSARYCEGSDEDRTKLLLKNMENVPEGERSARFVSAICCVFPNGDKVEARGECEGEIAFAPSGAGGFGYDPVFYVKETGATFAEMDGEIKNKISHRGRALASFKVKMELYLAEKGHSI